MYFLRWVRRYIRKKAYFIDPQTGVNLHRKLTFIYLFFASNAFFGLLMITKRGNVDYALDLGLKTEIEAEQSKAVSTLEMLGIEKAKILTFNNFTFVKEEDYESYDLKKSKEKKEAQE